MLHTGKGSGDRQNVYPGIAGSFEQRKATGWCPNDLWPGGVTVAPCRVYLKLPFPKKFLLRQETLFL